MIEPTIFLGAPGTGKTTALLDTVEKEMEAGVPPDKIGYMTFTKRGVEEAISRASSRFKIPRAQFRYFNTLHSAAFRHMGYNSDQVFTGKRVEEFGKLYGLEIHGSFSADDGTYTSFYDDDLILFFENYARITRQPVERVLSNYDYAIPDSERARKVIQVMREYKAKEHLYDFTDMIETFVKADDPPWLDVLIVDEAQDLSNLQWLMVDLLSRHVKRKYMAGDDDQTIFTWAGASEHFISMPGKVQVLGQSYRVPVTVQNLANKVISQVLNRRPKEWNPRPSAGSVTSIEGISQLDPVSLVGDDNTVMLLGRTTKLLRQKFIPYCRGHGILYKYFENNSIRPTHARAIDAWNSLQNGERITADQAVYIYDLLPGERHGMGIAHGYKTYLRQIADQPDPPVFTIQELRRDYGLLAEGSWNEVFVKIDKEDVKYIQKVMANGFKITDKPKIHVSTVHRVKGGQANTVILLSDTAKAADRNFTMSTDEETRVFYTGITRTFEDLVIVHPEKRHYYERLFE